MDAYTEFDRIDLRYVPPHAWSLLIQTLRDHEDAGARLEADGAEIVIYMPETRRHEAA